MSTVADMLGAARQLGLARLDAQLLIGHALQRSRAWVLAHDDAELSPPVSQSIQALLQRRSDGEPLAYLTGEKEFHGLALEVSPAVLIPRPDTEILVAWALDTLGAGPPQPQVLDLGTGSGAVALAIKQHHPQAQVTALDISADALAVAQANAERLGLPIRFERSDWWSTLGSRRYDLIVSNPPYIAEGDPHLPALRHEPQLALTSGRDGLDALRHIVAGASAHLTPGAWLLLEHGHNQAEAVQQLLTDHGFRQVQTRRDLAGVDRCTGAQWR